jgi:hypothetical protein
LKTTLARPSNCLLLVPPCVTMIMSCEEENIDSKPLVDQLLRRHTGITPALCVEEGEIPPTMAKLIVATTPSTGPTPRNTKVKADSTEFNGT